jgi:hypothetical protein
MISLAVQVTAAGFRWPDYIKEGGVGPLAVVIGAGLFTSTILAAAAHSQMTGAWPALIMGIAAPSVVRGILARVEVTQRVTDLDGSSDA